MAGLFLFLPVLARLSFDHLVTQAGYPGSVMVPASAALLSLLALKLLDKERRSHINDFNCDEALGLWAGLNILPKKSFATAYSYRTQRSQQYALLSGWVRALGRLLCPEASTFSVDFHPIPHRGDESELEQHYIPQQGRARPSVQTFFAVEQQAGVLCYANANLTRQEQAEEVVRFVEFWEQATGVKPQWLYFDSKLTTYAQLQQLNRRQIWFVTIRRRGAAVLRRLRHLPPERWQTAVLDTPQRCHQRIRYVEDQVRLPDYAGTMRQVAVDGLGREEPTLLLSNNTQETARNLLLRYAGRNRVEDGLGSAVDFFHVDCLTSEVRLNVDLDSVLTVLAHGCYRWLGQQLKGYGKSKPKQLYRRFVETGGVVEVEAERLVVRLDRRSHNPILREAGLDRDPVPIPWLQNRLIHFEYT